MRSLIDILDLSVEEIDSLIATAKDIIENPENIQKNARERSLQHCSLNLRQEQDLALRLQ